jgi:hypothetical protein
MRIEPWQIPVMVMAALAVPVWLYHWTQEHFSPQKSLTRERSGQVGFAGVSPPEDLGEAQHDSASGSKSPARGWARTAAFGMLTLLLVVILGVAFGPTIADRIVAGATAVSTVVAAHLTLQSLLSQRTEQLRESSQKSTTTESADSNRSA